MSVPADSATSCASAAAPSQRRRIAWDLGELAVGLRPHPRRHLDTTPPPAMALLHCSRMVHRLHRPLLRKLESHGLQRCGILALVVGDRPRPHPGSHRRLLRRQPAYPAPSWRAPRTGSDPSAATPSLRSCSNYCCRDISSRACCASSPGRTSQQSSPPAVFALAHLPNPILTPLTLIWGFAACLVFIRSRNVYPLAIAHAIFGICVAITIPASMLHNMRVGLGYINYRPRPLHLSQSDHVVSTDAWVIAEAPTRR